MTTEIHSLMMRLASQEAKAAEIRAQLELTDLGQEAKVAEAKAAELREQLKEACAQLEGTTETPNGLVGYQLRRTVTHKPAAVRELAPDLAAFCIAETVDKKTLETMAKAAVKSGKAPANLIELLEAQADVKTTKAWLCQPVLAAEVSLA